MRNFESGVTFGNRTLPNEMRHVHFLLIFPDCFTRGAEPDTLEMSRVLMKKTKELPHTDLAEISATFGSAMVKSQMKKRDRVWLCVHVQYEMVLSHVLESRVEK